MLNFVNGLFSGNHAKFLADLFGVLFGAVGSHVKTVILNILGMIWNVIVKYVWIVCKWVLGALDAMQLAFTRLLGLYTSTGAEMTADDYIEGMKEITVSGGSNYYDYIMKIFKAVAIVAIVLMIVFTIFAMVMQEYNLAVNGYSKADNSKGKLIKMILTNIISICLMPLIFYTVIVGVNSILTSFYRALGNYSDTTIAGNVLAASTYDANRYRAYANAGQRIPITISVYSMENEFGKERSNEDIMKDLQDTEIQMKLKSIAGAFANNSFLPFEKSTVYINGNWSSYPNYSLSYDNVVYDDLGQYFENFICTREQYYILADFVDYCQRYNINYYIKEISEPDICWKYVSSLSANSEIDEDGNSYGDITLTINYKDAENINNPSETVSTSSSSDTYSLKLTTKLNMTSPISDALKTASTLLGLTEETSSYYAMERDDSGDFTNLVEWSTEKVMLKLSDSFNINDSRTWTFADQIIVYEYYRFQNNFNSTNNTLEDYTLEQLKTTGAKLDVLELSYRNYNSNTQSYSDEKSLLCVKINSSYYRVTESSRYFDDYGSPYYELDVLDPNVKYFKDATVKIQETGSVATRLSSGFDINTPYTTDAGGSKTWKWTFTDQVLVYEYFTNGRISNGTKSVVDFTKLNNGVNTTGDNAFKFNIYKITTSEGTNYYIKINNTFYECESSGALIQTVGTPTSFLIDSETAGNWWYGYNLTTADKAKYGIDSLRLLITTTVSGDTESLDNRDAFYQKFSGINRKLSEDFSFYNSDTWTFKDYAIMYLYVNYLKDDLSTTVDSLQVFGIKGDVIKVGGKYYVEINQTTRNDAGHTSSRTLYLDIEKFSKISELKITTSISLDIFESLNMSSNVTNLIKSFDSDLSSDYLINSEVSSQTFYVSEDFDEYIPTTWTIGDYLFLYLIDNDYIEVNDFAYLQKQGYKALVYEVEETEDEVTKTNKYYRFGKNITSEDGSKNENVYFLSENGLSKLGFSINKFFKTNLLAFLLNNKYGINFDSLYYDEDEFAQDVIASSKDNIYNIDTNYSNIKNLQNILASDFLDKNADDILHDVNVIKYTYSNPEIDAANLATWHTIDAVIYLKTGSLPTTDNPYTSYLYKHTDDKIYMLVDDVFVDISGSIYTGGSDSMLTEQIFSNTIKSFTSTSLYQEYYENNFESAFLFLGESTSGSITTKTEIRTTMEKIYYVTTTIDNSTSPVTTSTNEIEIKTGKLYYYSENLRGSSGTASITANNAYTAFEIIMANKSVALTSDGYYCFDKYVIDDETYVKIGSSYFNITTLTSAAVYYQENSLIANTSYAFSYSDNYVAFDDDTLKETILGSQINKFDAILYSISHSTEKTEYKLYDKGSDKYLLVNGKIVKYDETLKNQVQKISETITDCFADSDKALAYAKALYDNYYRNFVTTGAPAIVEEYTPSALGTKPEFKSDNMNTWTGLSIILNFIGSERYDLSVGEDVNFTLIKSTNNNYYLKITVSEATTGDKTYYILLSGLVDTNSISTVDAGGNMTISFTDIERTELFLRLARVKETVSGSETTYSLSSAEELSIDVLSTSLPNTTNLNNYRDNCKEIGTNVDDVKGNILNTWNWLGLISLYYEPVENDGLTVSSYYYNGKNYYVFTGGIDTYIIPVDLFVNFNSLFTAREYTLNSSSNIGKVINNKGHLAGSKIYQFTSTSMSITFYLVQKDASGNYYAVYNLDNPATTYSSPVKFIKATRSGASVSNATEETNSGSATSFIYTTKSIENRNNWNIFDYIFAYVTGKQFSLTISSYIYVYDSNYYVKYEDKYILLPVEVSGTGALKKYLKFNTSDNMFEIDKDKFKSVLDTLQDVYSYNKTVTPTVTTGNTYCLIKYASTGTHSALSTKLYNYERKFCETNGNKVHGEGNSLMRIDFSNKFDVSDYSTWTYSDFVIYYAFSQGMFGEEATNYKFPFVYVPSWTKSGNTYYNLSYLDMILVDIYGERASTAIDGKYPLESTTYFDRTDASYNFYLYYISSGTNKGYYLTLNENGSADYYVRLSDNIVLDFTSMKVTPELLGENLTIDDIKDKLLDPPDDLVSTTPNEDGITSTSIKNDRTRKAYLTEFIGKNFQTFVNAHGAPGYTYYLLKQNEDTGSSDTNYVINFALEDTKGKTGTYFNYETFYDFYEEDLKNYLETIKENSLDVTMSMNNSDVLGDVKVEIKYENYYPDLAFVNYYYISYTENGTSSYLENVLNVDTTTKTNIINGNGYEKKLINLQLSTNFQINNISTWTVLDYILVYEFSNEKVNSNFFKDMLFSELKEDEYLKNIAYTDGNEGYYLYINNNFYRLTGFVENRSDCLYGLTTKKINANDSGTVEKIKKGSVGGYSFRVPYETLNFSVNPMYSGSVEYSRDKNNISLTEGEVLTYHYIDTDVAETNYRINVSQYGYYSTKKYIRTVSWVEKLMNDMQVYYPDLNWGVLIATDGWLDTLGEFTSAHNNGLYVGGDNSANTTAAGLVLSEFFISKATAVTDSYADYEYSTMFDEDTVDALMLSLLGEENFQALSFEASVFMDFFNSCFAPIIDDFAEEFGENINENSLRLNAYKSYLATLLLSSDIGEYLYTVATRIYAEYTIGEYLAKSCGDYGDYYAYVNQLTDQDGNTVNSFSYGSFIELLKYENDYCGNNNPTFTFNFKKAFDLYGVEDGGVKKIMGYTYDEVMANDSVYKLVAQYIINVINSDYKAIYRKGYDVSESWTVIDSEGEEVNSYYGSSFVYCYMIHVYWDIEYNIKTTDPSYLELYKKYIDGDVERWSILYDNEIETADQYFENYNSDKFKLTLYKNLTGVTSLRLFLPALTANEVTGNGFLDLVINYYETLYRLLDLSRTALVDLVKYKEFGDATNTALGELLANGTLPIANALDICSSNTELTNEVKYVAEKALIITTIMELSEESTNGVLDLLAEVLSKFGLSITTDKETNWNIINEYYDAVSDILSELKEVQDLLPGQKTGRGSSREIVNTGVFYTDDQLDQIINAFSNIKTNLKNYIATQTRMDKAQKKSITFTLAQYGSNYVESGYSFSVKNKTYTFKSNIDPTRLAEYVYGGAFLEEVGVGAQYTSGDFKGIVNSSKVYDNVAGTMKTKLDTWPELREFASAIAKETAELYFTTNLADLDISKENAVLITDNILVTNTSGTGTSSDQNSIEKMLYSYIISGINDDIVKRITNSDDSEGNTINDYTHAKFVAMCKYIFSGDVADDELENITMEDFKRIVMRKLIDNDQNEDETPEERAGRYMTLYNLLSVQVVYQTIDTASTELGRIISKGKIKRTVSGENSYLTYSESVSTDTGASSGRTASVAASNIKATFSASLNTLEVVKKLSGLENRPTREVLTREYSGTRTADYYDEAFGDSFIACTYKNGLYYPVIGTGSRSYTDDKYADYLEEGFLNHKFISDYYDNTANVVVMKGIITADGYPTAIRKYNNPLEVEQKKLLKTTTVTYNSVAYYRTNVGVNFGEGEDLIDASRAVGRVTTQNYTKYESNTSYTKGLGSSTTYTGRTNMKTVVSSDYSSSLVQSKVEYLIGQADDYGAISVLDDFSYFYVFGGQTWVLLMLAFITIIPFMINAIGGAISRIFDMLVLFIISPLVISTNSLYPEGKNKTYQKWKKGVQINAFSMFGYIMGFSAFSILVPMIYNVNSFVSVSTYNRIVAIGGLGGYFSYPTINSLVKCLWIITAVSVFEKVPGLLLPIITANRGGMKSPHPGVTQEGQSFMDKTKSLTTELKNISNQIKSVTSGAAVMGAAKNAKDELLSMIPGSAGVKLIKEGIFDPKAKDKREKKAEQEQKEIEKLLKGYGIDDKTAKSAGEAVKKAQAQKEKQKAANKKKWEGYQKQFRNLL